jgi:predicted nucleic acid-binding protein
VILVDTSVWVDHFRNDSPRLSKLLTDQQVLVHPFIIGELSLGRLTNRNEIVDLLSRLPLAPVAEHDEVTAVVDKHHLPGSGIGWVDAHLIASALLGNAKLLTADKPLQRASRRIGVDAS